MASFIHSTLGINKKQMKPVNLIDTPTRLVNESNEFLEIHLAHKRKNNKKEIPDFTTETVSNNYRDEGDSSLENTLN